MYLAAHFFEVLTLPTYMTSIGLDLTCPVEQEK